MKIQRCVRTFEEGYETLNSYLEKGWRVVLVTPKSNYNEYILEKEVEDDR